MKEIIPRPQSCILAKKGGTFDMARIDALDDSALLHGAQIQALSDRGEFIEDCIAEMAMMVYQ